MTIFTTGSLITAAGAQQLESSFAGASSPASPVTGQLWYDIPNSVLKVYTGSSWEKVSGSSVSVSETPPAGPAAGSLWFNVGDTVARLFVWDGVVWVDTNPSGSSVAGGGLGVGQTWQDMTASRAATTVYTNTTGKPIQVNVMVNSSGSANHSEFYCDGVLVSRFNNANNGQQGNTSAIIPPGSTYSLTIIAGVLYKWMELR